MSAPKKQHRDGSLVWRVLTPAVFLLAGGLFVASSISSDGTDLRAGRYGNLDTLVNQQSRDLEQLRARAADLSDEINDLSAGLGDGSVRKAQARADALREPAGLEPAQGPGITVTLDDAPESVRQSADIDVANLVVHQQDIQAVVNALWAGGAEAMTIQGQRVVSTTGIKCVGNTVVLHDVPYAPPYVISAIGDPVALLDDINTSPYIQSYLRYVEAYELGWSVDVDAMLKLPGYEGSLELSYARPAGDTGSTADSDT